MNKPSFLAIIPARGGSKGIPNKNIFELNAKPLIAWTIEAAKQSVYITRTMVSSDDDKILAVAQQYGADVIIRPTVLAQDTTPTGPVIDHVVEQLSDNGEHYDYIVLLQPTSPLRNASDIDNAIEKLLQ